MVFWHLYLSRGRKTCERIIYQVNSLSIQVLLHGVFLKNTVKYVKNVEMSALGCTNVEVWMAVFVISNIHN